MRMDKFNASRSVTVIAIVTITMLAACRTTDKTGNAKGTEQADAKVETVSVDNKIPDSPDEMNENRVPQRQSERQQTIIRLNDRQREMMMLNNRFAFRFMKAADSKDTGGKGFIYSPLSITLLMGMINDGATGETRREIEEALGFGSNDAEEVNEYCKTLMEGLPGVDPSVTLNMANAIFVSRKYSLQNSFVQRMENCYSASAESLDFESPSTLRRINGWCNEKTRGMIPSILDEIDPTMASYLLNAIYFKADWTDKFDEKDTRDEEFDSPQGKVMVPMMHRSLLTGYAETQAYQAVSIAYGNGQWSLEVLLPKEGANCADIIGSLDANGWRSGAEPFLSRYRVDLKLPRFETSSDTDESGGLIELMKSLGINLAFDENLAQIPGICNEDPLYIKVMKQKARIKVNEKGSEAAAVTVAGMMKVTSAGPREYPTAVFHADHPFVYLIRENSSGAILFTGKYTGKK